MAVTKVVMPKLSEQMESGKVIKWLKKEGDRVQSGDILAEVETDKADVEMEAFGAGVLRKILVSAGSTVPVGSLIGVIAEANDDINSVVAQAGAPAPAAEGGAKAPSDAAAPTDAKPGMADRPAAVPPQPRSEDPAARKPSPSKGPRRRGASACRKRSPGPRTLQTLPSGDGGRVKHRRSPGRSPRSPASISSSSRAAGPAAASSAVTSRPRQPRRRRPRRRRPCCVR